jgi:COMPASS component SWD2
MDFRREGIKCKDVKMLATAYSYQTSSPITSIDFSEEGNFVAAAQDHILYYEFSEQKPSPQRIRVATHGGCEIVKLKKNFIIHSTKNANNNIKCVDNSQRSYVNFYPGHSKRIASISLSNESSSFLFASGSEDKTIRLWNKNQQNRVAYVETTSTPFVAFHPTFGWELAAATDFSVLKFDIRQMDKVLHKFNYEKETTFNGLKYSDDGKLLMVSTNKTLIITLNSDSGEDTGRFYDFQKNGQNYFEASFTPFSEFICSGSSNGQIHFWDVKTGQKIAKLKDNGLIECVKFNPVLMMMATAAKNQLRFWIEKE